MTLSCTTNNEAGEREEYWITEANKFFAVERNMKNVHSWLRDKGIYYAFDDSDIHDGKWIKILEDVRVETFVCESWVISIAIEVDSNKNVENYEITKVGSCL